jgi:hypothetical protein
MNNLLNRNNSENFAENYDKYNKIIITNINRLFFITTFMYYRVYSYYVCLLSNKEIHNTFLIYSKSKIQLFEIYLGIYGLFILNLYWAIFIFIKLKKSIKGCDKAKNV